MTDALPRGGALVEGASARSPGSPGGATFLTGIGVLGASPMPAPAQRPDGPARSRPRVIVRQRRCGA